MVMTENERLAIVEQRVKHMEGQMDAVAAKVDEMHTILIGAKSVRWAVVTLVGIAGSLSAAAIWLSQHVGLK